MPLTEKQKVNIEKLDRDTIIEILDICTEKLGIMSIDQYCKLEGITRRRFYYEKTKGKIKTFRIDNYEFPIFNNT